MKIKPTITISKGNSYELTITECDLESSDTPIGIRNFRIKWGKDEYLDDHKPATLDFSFVVFDTAAETSSKFFFGGPDMQVVVRAYREIIFRGFPRNVHARRTTINGRSAFVFDVTAVDETVKLASLAPSGPGIQSWLQTRGDSARDMINDMLKKAYKNLVNNQRIKEIGRAPNERTYNVQIGSTDWGSLTLDKYISLYYRSFGGYTWDYNPHTEKIFVVQPGPSSLQTYLKRHSNSGVYVTPRVSNSEQIGIVILDGKELAIDEIGFEITPRQTLRDIAVKYYDHDSSKAIEGKVQLHDWGQDTTSVDTMLAPRDKSQANQFVRSFARHFDETFTAATLWPEIPPIRYRFTDLPSTTYIRYWLAPYSSSLWGLVRNSAILDWLQGVKMRYPANMTPPTVAPKGGIIEFDGKEWLVEQNLSIVGNFDKGIRSVTYETLNEGATKISEYADRATWADFQMLTQNNTFREQ